MYFTFIAIPPRRGQFELIQLSIFSRYDWACKLSFKTDLKNVNLTFTDSMSETVLVLSELSFAFQPLGNRNLKCSRCTVAFSTVYHSHKSLKTFNSFLCMSIQSGMIPCVTEMLKWVNVNILLYLISQKGKLTCIMGIIVIQDLCLSSACDRKLCLLHSKCGGSLTG